MNRQSSSPNTIKLPLAMPTPCQPWQTTPTKREIPAVRQSGSNAGRYCIIGGQEPETERSPGAGC